MVLLERGGVRHRGLMAVCCSPGALLAIQPPLSTARPSSNNVVVRVPRVSLAFVKMPLELNLLPKGITRHRSPCEYYFLLKKLHPS